MKSTLKKTEKGITLVALVVTIVVLLILAGVSINLVLGNNGIIAKAKEAETKPSIETSIDETKTTSDAKEEFTQSIKVKTYNQILEDIANEYNEEYDTKLSAADITYIKSNPQFLAIDNNGEYIQDYKQTQKYGSYIQDKIKNIYVFINKEDNTIISSIGKVADKVQNIDTKIVMDSQRKEYISNNKKIDITQGKTSEEIEEIYNAMEIKQQEKEKNNENQIKYIDNSR